MLLRVVLRLWIGLHLGLRSLLLLDGGHGRRWRRTRGGECPHNADEADDAGPQREGVRAGGVR